MKIKKVFISVRRWVNNPRKVFFIAMVFFLMSVLFNGTLWRIWSLHQDKVRLGHEILTTKQSIARLDKQLSQARDPHYIERQARDKLDLVGEDDLIFVFPANE